MNILQGPDVFLFLFHLHRYASKGYKIKVNFDQTSNTYRTLIEQWDHQDSVSAKKILFHPMFDQYSYEYDIAILELERPVMDRFPISLDRNNST